MVIEGATDAAVFRAYVKHVLAPTLRPGEIVVMDNLSSHKGPEIREMVEAARGGSVVPAAVFAGPQPDQKNVVKGRSTPPPPQAPRNGGHPRCRAPSPEENHAPRRPRMVRVLRLCLRTMLICSKP